MRDFPRDCGTVDTYVLHNLCNRKRSMSFSELRTFGLQNLRNEEPFISDLRTFGLQNLRTSSHVENRLILFAFLAGLPSAALLGAVSFLLASEAQYIFHHKLHRILHGLTTEGETTVDQMSNPVTETTRFLFVLSLLYRFT